MVLGEVLHLMYIVTWPQVVGDGLLCENYETLVSFHNWEQRRIILQKQIQIILEIGFIQIMHLLYEQTLWWEWWYEWEQQQEIFIKSVIVVQMMRHVGMNYLSAKMMGIHLGHGLWGEDRIIMFLLVVLLISVQQEEVIEIILNHIGLQFLEGIVIHHVIHLEMIH